MKALTVLDGCMQRVMAIREIEARMSEKPCQVLMRDSQPSLSRFVLRFAATWLHAMQNSLFAQSRPILAMVRIGEA